MRYKEVSISKGIKISMNYNSINVGATLVVELDDGEDINEVSISINKDLDNILAEEVKKAIEQLNQI